MIIHKQNVEEFKKRFKEYSEEGEKEYAKNIPLDDYIQYELYNHECFYTGNYSEALNSVQCSYPHCSIEDVKRVFYLELPNTDN